MKEVDAANLLLDESSPEDRFTIKWGFLKLKLEIKPVSTRGMVKISKQVSHLKMVNDKQSVFIQELELSDGLIHVCRAIAISTRTRFPRIVARAISNLSLKNVRRLWEILIKQSDYNSFFFIMVSAKGMEILETTIPDRQKEETHSSVG